MPDRPNLHIIGVPLDLGSGRRGVDMGPSALRIAGMGDRLSALGYRVVDEGDIETPTPETLAPGDPTQKFAAAIGQVCGRLHDTTYRVLSDGGLPIVLGGDHSIAAGSVAASARAARRAGKALGLLWIDAHGDMNTPSTTVSGNVHGMPLAALLGPEPSALSSLSGFSPAIEPDRTVLIGVRNLDDREKQLVRDSRVHVFTMKDIDRHGMADITERALALVSRDTYGVHVSFDLDVCDPAIAPGVGTPVKGGLDYREAHVLMETLADSGLVRAIDFVEVNPVLDVRNSTAILGVELALSALGQSIL
ncbi:MAG: arginase [Vicinamibacterales bacterium]